MKQLWWIFSFVLLMRIPLAAQSVVVYFDDDIIVEDTIVEDTIVEDTIVEPINTYNEDTAVVLETDHYYRWRDVRAMRDSFHIAKRNNREAMNANMRQLRHHVRAEALAVIDSMPHEIRIGWGDMLFENLIWRNQPHPTVLPEDYTGTYNERYRYTQHWFAEYLYNIGYWYSVGLMVDYSGVMWDNVTRNGLGQEIHRIKNRQFHNIAIVPMIRFSYLHSEYVSLYSALGIGLNINTGTEIDYKGRSITYAPAVNISLLGMRVGKGRWLGMLELGGMISLMSSYEVYMLGSRIFTASVGCRL